MRGHDLSSLLKTELVHNSVEAYFSAGWTFLVVLGVCYALRRLVVGRLRAAARDSSAAEFNKFMIGLLGQLRMVEFILLAFFIATKSLELHAGVEKIIRLSFVLALTYRGVRMLQTSILYGVARYAESAETDPTSRSAYRSMLWLVNLALWVGAGIFVLDNLGVSVGSVMTGLGIGGVAVALAAQAILGDLFSSFSILLDQPFKVGDFINVDGMKGTVEQIGVKTTRVRSIDGELLVFANSDLTKSRIRNFGLMQERRVVFQLNVDFATPSAKVRRIPALIEDVVKAQKGVRWDRAHFVKFGDWSLVFEGAYFVSSANYNIYMDFQQAINFALMDAFEKEGVRFAFPTQTVRVQGLPGSKTAA